MIKRFSTARKVLRLSIFLALFFIVYFVMLSALFSNSDIDSIGGEENPFDLVFYDSTPINFDKDDGQYVGQVINCEIAPVYKSFGSKSAVPEDTVCLFTQFSTDRLDAFIELADSWNSYISVALYVENENHLDYMYIFLLIQ